MLSLIAILASAIFLSPVASHVTLWSPGMYNFNGTATGQEVNWNNNEPVNPLKSSDGLTVEQWWGHGDLDRPPKVGDFLELPARSVGQYSLACNRALSEYRDPALQNKPLQPYACDDVGPLHTINDFGAPPDDKYLGGCALSIVYESDVSKISPSMMTVVAVNHTCVWAGTVDFVIPDLPPCPPGGCHCGWNWIHTAGNSKTPGGRMEGFDTEMYSTLYKCRVNGATSSLKVGASPQPPKECASDPSKCVVGPKQPLYWSQKTGNNVVASTPPTHNMRYGFRNGAQNDIFESRRYAPRSENLIWQE